MNGFLAFTKKEFFELTHTYRLFLLLCVFALFGFISPLTAKYTPQLIESMMSTENMMPEGVTITIPEPTAVDSWVQFHKNISQIGFLILIILFCGGLSTEYSHGTLVQLITRGLPRPAVLFAKLSAASTVWTASLLVCFGITFGYTAYFWDGAAPANLLFAVCCLWLLGILLLSLMLLGGTLFTSVYGTLLLTGGLAGAALFADGFTALHRWNPARLSSGFLELLSGTATPPELVPALIVTVLCIAAALTAACLQFRRVKL